MESDLFKDKLYSILFNTIFDTLQSYDEKVNPLASDGYGISKSDGYGIGASNV